MRTPFSRAFLLVVLATAGCSLLVDTEPYLSRTKKDTDREAASRGAMEAGIVHTPDGGAPPSPDAGLPPKEAGIDQHPDASETAHPNHFVSLEKGSMSAVVIGQDDLPLVFFHADELAEEDDLGVIECHDADCSRSSARSLEFPGNSGTHVHARLDSAGLPILSYNQAAFGGEAKFMRCADTRCARVDTWFLENGAATSNTGLGEWSSIALGADGFPIVSYFDRNSGDLRAAICRRPDCCEPGALCSESTQGPALVKVAGDDSIAGEFGAVAVGTDGNPVFAYYNGSRATLDFAYCTDPSCSKQANTHTLDETADVGKYVALLIGGNGYPLVFYYDATYGDLKLARCLDARCEQRELRVIDGDGALDVGLYTSAVLASDGMPVLSYFDQSNQDLKVARCTDMDCTHVQVRTVDGHDSRVGAWTSIALRASDGLPVISYQNLDTRQIKLAFCGTKSCAP